MTALTRRDSPTRGPRNPPAAGAERRAQAKGEDEGRRELRNPGGQRVAGETGANSTPRTRTRRRCWPRQPGLPGPHVEGGGGAREQRGAGRQRPETTAATVSRPSILSSSAPAGRGDFQAPLHSPEAEKEEPSREMMQGKRRIAELTGHLTRLQAERSLHGDNAQLARDAQKPQLPLPSSPTCGQSTSRTWRESGLGSRRSTCTGRRSVFPRRAGGGPSPVTSATATDTRQEDGRGPAQRIAEEHLLPRPAGVPLCGRRERSASCGDKATTSGRGWPKPSGPRSRLCPGDLVRAPAAPPAAPG